MFNNKLRKDAIQHLQDAQKEYEKKNNIMIQQSQKLFDTRIELKKIVDGSWDYINSMRNKPKEMDTTLAVIKVETSRYSELLSTVTESVRKSNFQAGGTAAAGIVAGVGVAAAAPAAAMAVAMTFGTASTGTAIATLSGAAATNAALAWLGGGAIVAGGGGMAGGSLLLGLAGPVGWIIGGTAVTAAGLIKSGKNKKIANQAYDEAGKINAHKKTVEGLTVEIWEIEKNAALSIIGLRDSLEVCRTFSSDYSELTADEKKRLGSLVNNTQTAAELLNKGIGQNA